MFLIILIAFLLATVSALLGIGSKSKRRARPPNQSSLPFELVEIWSHNNDTSMVHDLLSLLEPHLHDRLFTYSLDQDWDAFSRADHKLVILDISKNPSTTVSQAIKFKHSAFILLKDYEDANFDTEIAWKNLLISYKMIEIPFTDYHNKLEAQDLARKLLKLVLSPSHL